MIKKYCVYYIDDFLLDKFINQWIWEKMMKMYYSTFNTFLTFSDIQVSDLTTYTTSNFKRFLWNNLISKNWSSTTYNHYRKCLRCYCEYLKKEWFLEKNPFDDICKRKESKKLPKTLTKDQIKELLISLYSTFDKKTYSWYRNIVIVQTYLHTWLRLSELINLWYEDININESYLRVKNWKWDKERIVPLDNIIIKTLYDFDKFSRKEFIERKHFFLTKNWNKLTDKDLKRIIDKIRYWITFHFTWHQLRHTFATELVRNNFDIYNISQILWHTKIDTTKIYLSTDTQKLKKQLDQIKLFS